MAPDDEMDANNPDSPFYKGANGKKPAPGTTGNRLVQAIKNAEPELARELARHASADELYAAAEAAGDSGDTALAEELKSDANEKRVEETQPDPAADVSGPVPPQNSPAANKTTASSDDAGDDPDNVVSSITGIMPETGAVDASMPACPDAVSVFLTVMPTAAASAASMFLNPASPAPAPPSTPPKTAKAPQRSHPAPKLPILKPPIPKPPSGNYEE